MITYGTTTTTMMLPGGQLELGFTDVAGVRLGICPVRTLGDLQLLYPLHVGLLRFTCELHLPIRTLNNSFHTSI